MSNLGHMAMAFPMSVSVFVFEQKMNAQLTFLTLNANEKNH